MPAEPFSKGVILSLSYPTSQIRYSLDEGTFPYLGFARVSER